MTWPLRGLRSDTQRDYIRFVPRFATFLGRPPDTATADEQVGPVQHHREEEAQGRDRAVEGRRLGALFALKVGIKSDHERRRQRYPQQREKPKTP